ncbi:MAG: efflux RND transporter periplasmic adaptor subunit [Anaerolineales bacterium]|jgi:HlyD family secretion protein|nr:efflux RND transporter periplasmic adaptor subunit [Anaerolineales bacterium]
MRIFRKSLTLTLAVFIVLAAGACDVLANDSEAELSASGIVEIREFTIASKLGGTLTEVYVEEGTSVEEGDPLFRIDDEIPRAQRGLILAAGENAIAAARLQLLTAQQALDDLFEGWSLVAAQAGLELAHARDALKDATYVHDVRQEGYRASSDTIKAAEANLVLANEEVDAAQQSYDHASGDAGKALALSNLIAAKQQRDSIQRNLNWYLGAPTDLEQAILDADVAIAEARVSNAELELAKWKDGPDSAAVELAEAQLTYAETQLALAKSQAGVELQTINLQLEDLISRAPVNGVVLTRNIQPGEVLAPGITALTIGDLDQLTITVYVPEDRYGEIRLGDEAQVSVDSFPDEIFKAVVVRIADRAEFTPRNVQTEEDRRTTVYAVELMVATPGGKLKPGMPADVVFELAE